jgi:outer membrane protein TolC
MRPILAAMLLTGGAMSAPPAPPDAAAGPSADVGPLTLDDALALAARFNADLLQARADAVIARADRSAATSALLPRLDLSASVGRAFEGASRPRTRLIGGVPVQVSGGPASNEETYSLNAQLTQTLLDWEQFREVDRARWDATAAERQYDETSLSVAFTVTQRFYEVVKQERSLAVLEQTAARSQELVDRADALFTAGRAPKSDTYTARVNLQSDRIEVEAQRARVAQARFALAQALGREAADAPTVIAPAALDAPGLPSGEPPPLDALLVRARRRRPALAAQAALVRAAAVGIGTARAGYLPSLQAQGSYTRSGPELSGSEGVYGDPTRAYSATALAVLSWNLFEGGRTRAGVQRAEAALARASAVRQATAEVVSREIADAREGVAALTRQVSLAADALGIAREALALATQRFDAGLASQLEVRDANLKLAQAELTLIQTRIDHAVAQADLARAVGGSL